MKQEAVDDVQCRGKNDPSEIFIDIGDWLVHLFRTPTAPQLNHCDSTLSISITHHDGSCLSIGMGDPIIYNSTTLSEIIKVVGLCDTVEELNAAVGIILQRQE